MATKKDQKLKRIVLDLKIEEHKKLESIAKSDLLPVKGAARKYLLLGISMLDENHGLRKYPSDQRPVEMPI